MAAAMSQLNLLVCPIFCYSCCIVYHLFLALLLYSFIFFIKSTTCAAVCVKLMFQFPSGVAYAVVIRNHGNPWLHFRHILVTTFYPQHYFFSLTHCTSVQLLIADKLDGKLIFVKKWFILKSDVCQTFPSAISPNCSHAVHAKTLQFKMLHPFDMDSIRICCSTLTYR